MQNIKPTIGLYINPVTNQVVKVITDQEMEVHTLPSHYKLVWLTEDNLNWICLTQAPKCAPANNNVARLDFRSALRNLLNSYSQDTATNMSDEELATALCEHIYKLSKSVYKLTPFVMTNKSPSVYALMKDGLYYSDISKYKTWVEYISEATFHDTPTIFENFENLIKSGGAEYAGTQIVGYKQVPEKGEQALPEFKYTPPGVMNDLKGIVDRYKGKALRGTDAVAYDAISLFVFQKERENAK